MNYLRTVHTLSGLLAVALLTSGFLRVLRGVLDRTADSGLALFIPFLAFAAILTALTSAGTALVLEMLTLLVLVMAIVEDGASGLLLAGGGCVIVMVALNLACLRAGRSD